ncbi:hypothetical protein DIPPA_33172 [Diplonema papillatum]|nr:hypothetical protein DIPPA_33172 [Diplonema papillatum]
MAAAGEAEVPGRHASEKATLQVRMPDDSQSAMRPVRIHYDTVSDVTQQVNYPLGWASETGAGRTYLMYRVFQWFALLNVVALVAIGIVLFVDGLWGNQELALWSATYCTVVSTVWTSFLIHLHLTTYTNPPEQRKIIRILLIVPVYSITSCLALKFYKDAAIYLNLVRDCYEAFVLYTFFYLMLDYLGGTSAAVKSLRKAGHHTLEHPFPMCCFGDMKMTRHLLVTWQCCIMQYVIFKPLLTLIAIICKFFGKYDEDNLYNYSDSYPWLLMLENLSVTIAFTCLFYFYLASKKVLYKYDPTGKFIAIKIVVFLCFWQGVLIAFLVSQNVIKHSNHWNQHQVATGLQDFLVCVEMLGVSVLHKKTFSHLQYLPETGIRRGKVNFNDVRDAVLDVRDVHEHSKGFWDAFGRWVKYHCGYLTVDQYEVHTTPTASAASTPPCMPLRSPPADDDRLQGTSLNASLADDEA